jgi:hypothetical protein
MRLLSHARSGGLKRDEHLPYRSGPSYESIKLGIDAHAKYYWVSRQVDGATPQPLQKMTCDELLPLKASSRIARKAII